MKAILEGFLLELDYIRNKNCKPNKGESTAVFKKKSL